MRIEDSFTVEAPAEQVYSALLTAEVLARAIPGCERLIQLGPISDDGSVSFGARIHTETSVWTVTLMLHGQRPERIDLDARTTGVEGIRHVSGEITLVPHNGQTLVSYSLSVEGPHGILEEAERQAALQALLHSFFERFPMALVEPTPPSGNIAEGRHDHVSTTALEGPHLRQVGQRALWLGGGLLFGVTVLALISNLARRLTSRE